jgi:alkylation response protein AidB-like acyl-CoA dehydrogenase
MTVAASETTELRHSLREAVRGVLQARGGTVRVHAVTDGVSSREELWREQAELGWAAVEVQEDYGGVDATFAELCVLLHELGRALSPTPLLSTAVLGVGALRCAPASLREEWLPPLAAGEATCTVALTGACGIPGTVGVQARRTSSAVTLRGECGHVLDLADASAVVTPAREGDTGELLLVLVDPSAEGVAVVPQPTTDRTRQLARLELRDHEVALDRVIAQGEAAEAIAAQLLDRLAIALAADSLGGAERVLELTVGYLKEREQFGRAIGSFQALKHRCADMLLALEASRSAVEHAAEAVDRVSERAAAASIAKSYAADAYVHAAGEGVQMHGGIGYTWEHDLHLHLKRAKLNQALGGDGGWHRDRLARLLLDDD